MLEAIDSAVAKGKRIRSARMLAGLNQIDLQKKHGIHVNTLKSWENPKGTKGLTSKGAQRLLKAFRHEGIICSSEWLLTGLGLGPRPESQPELEESQQPIPIATHQEEAILKEVQFFLDINPDSTIALITDNLMLPTYQIGDYVGGYKRSQDLLENFINTDCIVETDDETQHVCRYIPINQEHYYRIIYLNEKPQDSNQVKNRIKCIKNAAPIIWHRKKDNFIGE